MWKKLNNKLQPIDATIWPKKVRFLFCIRFFFWSLANATNAHMRYGPLEYSFSSLHRSRSNRRNVRFQISKENHMKKDPYFYFLRFVLSRIFSLFFATVIKWAAKNIKYAKLIHERMTEKITWIFGRFFSFPSERKNKIFLPLFFFYFLVGENNNFLLLSEKNTEIGNYFYFFTHRCQEWLTMYKRIFVEHIFIAFLVLFCWKSNSYVISRTTEKSSTAPIWIVFKPLKLFGNWNDGECYGVEVKSTNAMIRIIENEIFENLLQTNFMCEPTKR